MNTHRSPWALLACLSLGGGCTLHHAAGGGGAVSAAQSGRGDGGGNGGTSSTLASAGRTAPAADGGSQADASVADAAVAPSPCPGSVADLAVSRADRAGYPPYAVSGCALLYVAADGALRLRSLDSGSEMTVAEAAELPVRPSLAGPRADPARVMAWESLREQAVRVRFAGVTHSVRGSYQHTGQPRATRDAVVFSAWVDSDPLSDADVLLFDPATLAVTVVGAGAGQQLFADVSATQVAYSDFSEDADGRFDDNGQDTADLVIVERSTLARQTLKLPGKQAFPLFSSDGLVVYLSWVLGHPEPKLSAYNIMVWDALNDRQTSLAQIETLPPYVRPSVYGSTVEWVERPASGAERLMRARVSGGAPTMAFSKPGMQLYATASSADATWLATLAESQTVPQLLSVAR